MRAVAVRSKSEIGRPLSVLVPLIQDEIIAGDTAGKEHYAKAGELLLEVRESGQVAPFKWTKWLSENFALSQKTAYRYMTFAERVREDPTILSALTTMWEIVEPKEHKKAKDRRKAFRLHKPVDRFKAEKQAREDEVKLHRALALELIDVGFKALATRLHPDKGGPNNAMQRLNRVRRELVAIAKVRRFES